MNKSIFFFTIISLITLSRTFTITQNQPNSIDWPFTVCAQGNWNMDKLFVSSQPARNSNNDIDVLGTANDHIEFQNIDLQVKLNGFFLHSQTITYTNIYDDGDSVELKYSNFVPSFAPSGTYSLTFKFKSDGGKDNGCFIMTFKL